MLLPLLAACGGPTRTVGTLGYVDGFLGGIVADEPRAALAGRDTLSAGGTAADAAVSAYFALAVTMPGTAGLGGGGICLAYDAKSNRVDAIDFLPRPTAGGLSTVPSNVRGMALLHSRYGSIGWQQLLSGGETLARSGITVSRALNQQWGSDEMVAKLNEEAARLFVNADGKMLPESAPLRQPELGALIGRIRNLGAGEFYTGQLARQISEASVQAGGDISVADLRERVPSVQPPLSEPAGKLRLYMPPPPNMGGAVAADLYAMLLQANYGKVQPQDRPHLMAEALRRAMQAEARRLEGESGEIGTPTRAAMLMSDFQSEHATPSEPSNLPDEIAPPAASLAVIDRIGNGVSCAFTMMATLGTGHMLPGTGILLAPAPTPAGTISLVPLLAIDPREKRIHLAMGATGRRAAAGAAIQVVSFMLDGGESLEDALARPRLYAEGGGVYLEPDAGDSANVLRDAGHELVMTPAIGRVNAIWCPAGVPPGGRCEIRPDTRSAGLGLGQ